MHKIRFHFKHSISQSVLEQCWIRWWRMFRWIFCPQTFLKQFLPWILKFLKICFKTSSIVCEMTSPSKDSFCCIRVTIFARHFFFENVGKMMISFDGFPIHSNILRFWCKVWKFFELSDYCKNWFTSPPTVFAQWISLISKST